jgi:hypothetical protein
MDGSCPHRATGAIVADTSAKAGRMHKNHFDAVARSLSGPQALIPGHGQAHGLGLTQHPTGQAVSAEAGEIHRLDVLHVRAATQVADHTAEYRRLEFDTSFVIDRRKSPPKHAP